VILLDNNQILIASIFQSLKTPEIQEKSFLRHLVLNTYRMYRSKFKDEYGDLVICHDSSNCWRKDFFPEYKANRKQKQKADVVDWNGIYNKLHEIREEIRKTFPTEILQFLEPRQMMLFPFYVMNIQRRKTLLSFQMTKTSSNFYLCLM